MTLLQFKYTLSYMACFVSFRKTDLHTSVYESILWRYVPVYVFPRFNQ